MANEPTFNPHASIEAYGIFGFNSRRGLVALRIDDGEGHVLETQHTPAKAREIATFLLEAASAAEGDEALFLELEQGGVPVEQIGGLLMAIRTRRGLIDERSRREAREAIAFDQSNPDDAEETP